MHTSRKQPSKRLNFLGISFLILFISVKIFAQAVPVGFNEGLMGNSGVAITDATASSYYNPGLILTKKRSSYSAGGNTFSIVDGSANDIKLSSAKISPSYVSALQIFESFAHEFFLANLGSVDSQTTSTDSLGGTIKSNVRLDNFIAGYTFAFPALPLGFQTALRYTEKQTNSFYEFQDAGGATTKSTEAIHRQIDFLLSIGGTHQFGNYNFGYKYLSRGLAVSKKKEGSEKTFTYSQGLNQYQKTESVVNTNQDIPGEVLALGHSFKIGDHEFLTDSQFEEKADLTYTYDWSQTFGYKLRSAAGYQYMCGLSHLINKDVKYFGQSMYVSTGMSWLSRTYRSAIGLYYSVNKVNADSQTYGLTFSSEFIY